MSATPVPRPLKLLVQLVRIAHARAAAGEASEEGRLPVSMRRRIDAALLEAGKACASARPTKAAGTPKDHELAMKLAEGALACVECLVVLELDEALQEAWESKK